MVFQRVSESSSASESSTPVRSSAQSSQPTDPQHMAALLAARLAQTQSDDANHRGGAFSAAAADANAASHGGGADDKEHAPSQTQALRHRLQQLSSGAAPAPDHPGSARQMMLKSALQTALVRINHDKAASAAPAPLSSRSDAAERTRDGAGDSGVPLTQNPLFQRSTSASSDAPAVSSRVQKSDASAKLKTETADGMPSLRAPAWPALVLTVC